MKEIGGYIELDTYRFPMLHDNEIRLNCGRNALAFLIETKNIKHIFMLKFMCDSCNGVAENVEQMMEITSNMEKYYRVEV